MDTYIYIHIYKLIYQYTHVTCTNIFIHYSNETHFWRPETTENKPYAAENKLLFLADRPRPPKISHPAPLKISIFREKKLEKGKIKEISTTTIYIYILQQHKSIPNIIIHR
jgi:hypothetical protein